MSLIFFITLHKQISRNSEWGTEQRDIDDKICVTWCWVSYYRNWLETLCNDFTYCYIFIPAQFPRYIFRQSRVNFLVYSSRDMLDLSLLFAKKIFFLHFWRMMFVFSLFYWIDVCCKDQISIEIISMSCVSACASVCGRGSEIVLYFSEFINKYPNEWITRS